MENKTYETFKKICKNWNGLNPSTKIIPNKKKYSRKEKHKKKFENE